MTAPPGSAGGSSPGHQRCWFYLHVERACRCGGPRHIGGLCGRCFAGATALDRALALWNHKYA